MWLIFATYIRTCITRYCIYGWVHSQCLSFSFSIVSSGNFLCRFQANRNDSFVVSTNSFDRWLSESAGLPRLEIIVMRTLRSLAIIACVFYFKSESVSALPDQSCETFFCGPDIEGTLAGWLEWMTEGSPWDDKPNQKSPTTPQLPQSSKDGGANKPYLDNVPSTQEDPIEIFVTAEEDCKAHPYSPNAQSDAASQNLQYCNVATARLIWPARCDDTTQNTKTASIIGGMDNNFKTSKDPLCPQPGGVAFWLANITPSQSKALMQDAAAVRAVTANRPYKNDDLRRVYSRANKRQVPAADYSKRRLRKRDRLTVVKQSPADPSLTFLSTARRLQGTSKPRYTYSFFSYAGKGVRIYLIDSGLDHLNFEFDHLDDVNVDPYPRLEWILPKTCPHRRWTWIKIATEDASAPKSPGNIAEWPRKLR